MSNEYIPTIGIEVHTQLDTESKMFCSCSTTFGDQPNTHLCPVCIGLPGSLPIVNRRALILGLMAARAFKCNIPPVAQFARKHYHYPDLPKGYQITMRHFPIGTEGNLELLDKHDKLRGGIAIERVHLEEDSGKLIHDRKSGSLIDYNRAGIPLLEIVTRPEIHSAEKAVRFLKELRRLLGFLGISDANMEEGSFRCEINVSVHPSDTEELGTRVEIKNLNSFRAVERSIEHEIERQTADLKKGIPVRRATYGWDEKAGVTVLQRYKETSSDYRYIPEPDLPELAIEGEILDESAFDLEDIPVRRVRVLIERFGVSAYGADLLMSGNGAPRDDPYFVADFFQEAIETHGAHSTQAANLMTGLVFEYLNKTGTTLDQTDLTPKKLAQVVKMVGKDELSSTSAKKVIDLILGGGGGVMDIVKREGLSQVTDEDEMTKLVKQIIEENEQIVEQIKKGKVNAIGALVGAAMKKSDGQVNPKLVNEKLQELLLK
jgi:aspartyl-tRNA(Asn)/glutamyl-tRNA(Gln) amidotransferase subunit B